jgi:hypothetical protein
LWHTLHAFAGLIADLHRRFQVALDQTEQWLLPRIFSRSLCMSLS